VGEQAADQVGDGLGAADTAEDARGLQAQQRREQVGDRRGRVAEQARVGGHARGAGLGVGGRHRRTREAARGDEQRGGAHPPLALHAGVAREESARDPRDGGERDRAAQEADARRGLLQVVGVERAEDVAQERVDVERVDLARRAGDAVEDREPVLERDVPRADAGQRSGHEQLAHPLLARGRRARASSARAGGGRRPCRGRRARRSRRRRARR
jgi:hypothetical protein